MRDKSQKQEHAPTRAAVDSFIDKSTKAWSKAETRKQGIHFRLLLARGGRNSE